MRENGTLPRPSARRVFAAIERAIGDGSSASVSYIDFRRDPHRAQGGVSIAEAAGRDRRRRRVNAPSVKILTGRNHDGTARQRIGNGPGRCVAFRCARSRHPPQTVAACRRRGSVHPLSHGHQVRETIYGASVRAAAERATEHARKPTGSPSRAALKNRMLIPQWRDRLSHLQRWASHQPSSGLAPIGVECGWMTAGRGDQSV